MGRSFAVTLYRADVAMWKFRLGQRCALICFGAEVSITGGREGNVYNITRGWEYSVPSLNFLATISMRLTAVRISRSFLFEFSFFRFFR